jgi:D-alanyl-D-alanine carboxypeptidase
MSTKNRFWRRAALAVVLLVSGCTYSTDELSPSSSSPDPFASLENQVQLFPDEGAVAAVVQIRWPDGEWSRAYGCVTLRPGLRRNQRTVLKSPASPRR